MNYDEEMKGMDRPRAVASKQEDPLLNRLMKDLREEQYRIENVVGSLKQLLQKLDYKPEKISYDEIKDIPSPICLTDELRDVTSMYRKTNNDLEQAVNHLSTLI